MQRLKSALILAAALLTAPLAHAQLKVVTTIPDLADIARELGGERVEASSIARGMENIHAVPVRPSTLVSVSRADLFIQVGLSLEHAYVPGLLEASRNRKLRPGQPNFINVSDGWEPVEVPSETSRRQMVDLHPQGNPHINLAPEGGRHMADRILAGLIAVDPEGRTYFEERHAAYLEQLEAAEARWARLGEALAGVKLVTYHPEFSYMARSFGIQVVGYVEARPGVPPTARELADVIETMRDQEVGVVLTAKWSNNKNVRFVAEKTGARVLEVPVMVGGTAAADSWIALIDGLLVGIAEAAGVELPEEDD